MRHPDIMHAELLAALTKLDATIRECTALTCSMVIATGIPNLDTPAKVVEACELVRVEVMKQLKGATHQ